MAKDSAPAVKPRNEPDRHPPNGRPRNKPPTPRHSRFGHSAFLCRSTASEPLIVIRPALLRCSIFLDPRAKTKYSMNCCAAAPGIYEYQVDKLLPVVFTGNDICQNKSEKKEEILSRGFMPLQYCCTWSLPARFWRARCITGTSNPRGPLPSKSGRRLGTADGTPAG